MNKVLEKENIVDIVKNTDLKHIAIIMDGNRRWAKKRMLPTAMGHKAGVSSLKEVVKMLRLSLVAKVGVTPER